MSARQEPVAVNTSDDRCWRRRAWTPDGHGLYGLEGSPQDTEQTLFLIRDLAEFGLGSMAFALPVPAGPEPQLSEVEQVASPEGEHYAAVHHTYRTGRDLDLPETGGQR